MRRTSEAASYREIFGPRIFGPGPCRQDQCFSRRRSSRFLAKTTKNRGSRFAHKNFGPHNVRCAGIGQSMTWWARRWCGGVGDVVCYYFSDGCRCPSLGVRHFPLPSLDVRHFAAVPLSVCDILPLPSLDMRHFAAVPLSVCDILPLPLSRCPTFCRGGPQSACLASSGSAGAFSRLAFDCKAPPPSSRFG